MAAEPFPETIARNVHRAEGDTLPGDAIEASLRSDRFAVVRGLIDPDAVRQAVCRLRATFRAGDDRPTDGASPTDVRGNFQKLAIGTVDRPDPADSYARLLRVIFTPLFAEDRFGVHHVLRRAAEVRNELLGLRRDFALDAIEGGVWSATRIQQYPRGGGFLSAHRDASTVAVSTSLVGRYLQVLLVMTRRGVDFERGGAYVEHPSGRLDVEAALHPGDLLVYDGRTVHGVADVDPHAVLDLHSLDGRLAGLVNLYEAR